MPLGFVEYNVHGLAGNVSNFSCSCFGCSIKYFTIRLVQMLCCTYIQVNCCECSGQYHLLRHSCGKLQERWT